MMNFYKPLSSRKFTWLKNDVGDLQASPPEIQKGKRTWNFIFALMLLFMTGFGAMAQVTYTQNFTSGAAGWTGFSAFTDVTACGGAGGAMRFNLWSGASSATFASPILGTSNGTLHTLNFDYKIANWSANTVGTPTNFGSFVVQHSNAAAGPWTTIGTINSSNHLVSGACANKQFTFTPASGSSVYIRFVATWANGDYYLNFDNVSLQGIVTNIPSCATALVPANAATNVNRNTTLSWAAASGATAYKVYLGTTTSPALVATVSTTSYLPSPTMMSNTQYYWKVVPTNSIGDATGCTEQTFTTNSNITYCTPVTTFGCTDGDVIARVILNTLDNNSGTGCPSGTLGYSNYSQDPNLTTTLQAGTSYGLTVYAGQYSEGYAAWIDYNDDGIFSTTERVGFSNGQVAGSGTAGVLGSSATFPIALACNPPLGQHRLRVRAMYNISGSAVTACGDNSYGEIEDYTITISAAAACPQPSMLTASNVTSTTANLNWNIGCLETAWEVVVQNQGLGVPTGSGVATTTRPFAATFGPGIKEFYVRANCGGGSYSLWSGPYMFTAPACPTLLTPVNAATNVAIIDGAIVLDWEDSVGATSYDVYWGTSAGSLVLLGNAPTSTANITGILQGTTYYWSIRGVNDNGSSTDCAVWSFTTQTLGGNTCADAISLNTLTSPVSSATTSYTNNNTPTCNATGTAPDVFYSITVQPGFTLAIGQTENSFDSVHSTFYGSCGTPTAVGCTDTPDTEVVTWVNNTGVAQTFYYVVDGWSAGSGTFTLAWTLTPPPITVTSFSPTVVCSNEASGSVITLTGTNFSGATLVELNGVSTPFTVVNSTTIQVTLTSTSSSGVFKVTNQYTSGTSSTSFQITPSPIVAPISNGGGSICVDGIVDLDSASPGGTWSSSNTSIATVDAEGNVTGHSGGVATVYYSVTDNNCTTAVNTTITVIDPIVSTSPQNATVAEGDNIQFSVNATGGLSYQWRVSTNNGASYTTLTNSGPYSGVTTNTLTITNTPVSYNNNLYSVVITASSPCANFTSGDAILSVGSVGIVNQPSDVNLCSSGAGNAMFTITTSGNTTSVGWEVDTLFGFEPIEDGTFGNLTVTGADTETLSLSGVTTENNGWIFRAVLNQGVAYSNGAALNVYESASINAQPTSKAVCYSGGTSVFNVGTSGTVSSYEWQYSTDGVTFSNVQNGLPLGVTYIGADSAILSVTTTAVTPTSGTYLYRVLVAGNAPCATVTSGSAQLNFFTPSFTQQPVSGSVMAGATKVFTVNSTNPSPTYQWQYSANGTSGWMNVVNATPVGVTYTGATSASLSIVTSGAAVNGTAHYRAILTSGGCMINSNAASLTIVSYCIPSATVATSYLNSFTTTNGVANINNTNTGWSTGGYGNFSSQTVSQYSGQSINFNTALVGTTVGAAIWIDWNQDGTFSAAERVASTSSYVSVFSGTIAVPSTALLGNTRMRITVDFNVGSPSNPCLSTTGRREFEDYGFTVLALPACNGAPVAGTITSNVPSICVSGSAVLTASGYATNASGISLQWYSVANGLIAGATNPTYTTPVLTTSDSFFFRVSCNTGGFSDSNIITLNVNNPTVLSTTPGSRCGVGTVALSASASGTSSLNWYAASTGGVPLYTGTTFTTPAISSTTTYFVAATSGSSNENFGKANSSGADGSFVTTGWGIVFNATQNLTLSSTVIYPTGTGTVTLALYNSSGTELASTAAVSVTGSGLSTPVTVPLNFSVPAGTGYRLLLKSYTGITNLIRDFSAAFPYNSANASVTGSWNGSASTAYYFFYNLSATVGCSSARTAVIATVDTPPALTLSTANTTICSGASSSLVTITSPVSNYDTYTWSPMAGVSGSAQAGYSFSPTTTTAYTLTALQNGGSQCQNVATFNVVVNPLPTAISIVPGNTTVCHNASPLQLSATGGTLPNMVALAQDFNTVAPSWTITNGASSPPAGAFTYQNSPYTYSSVAYSTTNGGMFVMANSDVGGSGTTTNTMITSPVFSTVGFASAALTFEHHYQSYTGDTTVKLEISTDGGTTWTQLVNYLGTTVGTATVPANANVSLNSYLNQSNLRIRYHYVSVWGFRWIIDNVRVAGDATGAVSWSPMAGLFMDAAGTIPYTGGTSAVVYANPAATTNYSATVTSSFGCTTTSQPVVITVDEGYPFYVDNDGDNYGSEMVMLCSADANTPPAGYSTMGGDCDDTNAAVNPGATEILYNGIDDNCDGTMDEGAQITTQVRANQCGSTMSNIYTIIYADAVANATAYRFKAVDLANSNSVQYFVSPTNSFRITDLADYGYDKTYKISVEVQRSGVWLGYYGVECRVSTPSLGNSLTIKECGMTRNLFSAINAYVVPGATGYKFKITNVSNPGGPNGVMEIERNVVWFSLSMLPSYEYNTTYSVQVAVKTTGAYSAYGAACDINTTSFANLPLTIKQCGVTYTNVYSPINAHVIPNVTGYKFRVTNLATSVQQELTPTQSWITLSQIASYVAGASYSVEVAIKTTGDFGPYGPACTINAPAAVIASTGTTTTASNFKVVASPNPFSDTFALSITEGASGTTEVKVYDMIGKLLEVRSVESSNLSSEQLGNRYPSGVYNVVVTQGATVKTLKVIKR